MIKIPRVGKRTRVLVAAVVAVILLSLLVIGIHLAMNGPVLRPSGLIAGQERTVFLFTLGLGLLVIIPVFILLIAFAVKYRVGKQATYTPDASTSRTLEALWWGIPIVVIAILGVTTWVTAHQLDPFKRVGAEGETLNVKVIALQWKWLFIYEDQGVASVNELHIPASRPIHFDITADAPMSSFWIPELGSQVYAMNGMSMELNLRADHIGTYRGTNTNINGDGYSKMDFKVTAESDGDFAAWSNTVSKTSDPMTAQTYDDLRKPSTGIGVRYYALKDETLYNDTLMRYMSMDHETNGQTMPSMRNM